MTNIQIELDDDTLDVIKLVSYTINRNYEDVCFALLIMGILSVPHHNLPDMVKKTFESLIDPNKTG